MNNTNFLRISSFFFRFAIALTLAISWVVVKPAASVSAAQPPNIGMYKTISSGLFSTGNANEFEITYNIVVTNSGSGNGQYDLVDTPQFGAGVSIVSARYTRYRPNGTDGPTTLTGSWTLSTDEPLAKGASNLYEIELVVNTAAATGDALDCTLQNTETGTGMRNTATVSGDLDGSGSPDEVVSSTVCDPINHLGVTITTFQTYLPLDSNNSCNQGPLAMFYEVEVFNASGSSINDLKIDLNIPSQTAPSPYTGTFGLDAGESGERIIQTIAAGGTEHLFFYITYPCYNSPGSPPPWTGNLSITASEDDGGLPFSYARVLTTRSEISAQTVDILSSSLGPGVFLGQVIPYAVQFQIKNIGTNQDVYLQPAGNIPFNSACYRLIGMDVTNVTTSDQNPMTGITDSDDNDIYFLGVSSTGSDNYVTIEYYFLVTCANGTSVSVPFVDIGSGTQYKYVMGTPFSWPNVTNLLSIDKQTLDPLFSQGGGEHLARFVITITNNSTQDVYIDEIVDTLPTGEDIEDPFVDCSTWSADYTLPPNSRQVTQSISYSYPAQNDTGTVKWVGNQVGFVPPVSGEYRVPANNGTNDGKLVLCYTAYVQDVNGQYTDTASANASGISIGQDTATVTIGAVGLNLEKSGSLDITANSPLNIANAGDEIDYTFTISNPGTLLLKDVTLTDTVPPLGITITCDWANSTNNTTPANELAGGESVECTGTYVVTQDDIDAGSVVNTASVSAKDESNNDVGPVEDSHTEPMTPLSISIDLVKSVTSSGPYQINDQIDYEFTVENTGYVTLNTIALTDVKCDSGPTYQSGNTGDASLLSPGEKWTFSCSHTITAADFTATSVINTAYVTSKLPDDSDGPGDNDTETVNLPSATLVLQKAWTNGANGDTAQLSIDGTNDDTDTSTSNGAAGTQTDTTSTASVTVYVDETVSLSETLGGSNTGSYTTGLSCSSSDGTLNSALTYTSGALNGSVQISADDAGSTITCTFTNTRESATLNLNKEWANATVNDTADLSLNGVNDDLNNTSTADSSAETDTSVASITVYTGETVRMSESYGAGNSKSYTAELACNSSDGTLDSVLTYTSGALSGSLQIDPDDADGTITCTFTNTVSAVTLYSVTVVKDLIPSTDDGRFDLSVQVGTGSAAVVANDAGDGDSGTQGGIAENASVTVAETAQSPAILANYGTPSLECLTASQQSVSVTNGNFTMPDENVTCTFTNTRVSATLILRKAWVNGSGGDFTDLSIDLGGQNLAQDTSTSTGGDETNDIASATVYKGQTITLSEALDANNSSEYTRALNCSNNLGTLTYTPGAAVGSLLIDPESPGGEIYCTFTNTASEEPNLFDPPSAVKVLNADGLPEIEFTMTWINDSNTAAINVQIEDLIPAGTTYVDVPTDSLVCEDDIDGNGGQTNTTTCEYRTGPNRIFWEGTIGPDPGAANATDANDELVITFRVLVPDSVNEVENQGTSLTDRNNDNEFTDETTEASVAVSNIVRWTRTPEIDPPISRNRVPDTGFTPGVVTKLPEQPSNLAYMDMGAIWMEIPSLKVKSTIVGVPLSGDSWDTSWLYRETGWLEGSAFPTWQGNSVVTAHVYTADGKPGPFVDVKQLKYDDQIIVNILDQKYIFAVRDNKMILPRNSSYAFAHMEDGSYLTLITCQGYNPLNDSYLFRRVVRAVLVKVE